MGFKGKIPFRVWLVAVSGSLGGLWLATQLCSSPLEVDVSGEAKQVQISEELDPYLEIDSVNEVESINAGRFQPWTNSTL
jgi:hypothetical protein